MFQLLEMKMVEDWTHAITARPNNKPECLKMVQDLQKKTREYFMENRRYIDGLSSILAAYERKELPFKISSEDAEKLWKMCVQMCNGLNPTTKQKQLAEYYIS